MKLNTVDPLIVTVGMLLVILVFALGFSYLLNIFRWESILGMVLAGLIGMLGMDTVAIKMINEMIDQEQSELQQNEGNRCNK